MPPAMREEAPGLPAEPLFALGIVGRQPGVVA